MTDPAVTRLTEAQKECLRLVQDQRQAKEIARALGISEPAVKQRLRSARTTLGVSSSVEAARILARHEAGEAYPSRIYPSRSVAADDEIAMLDPSDGVREWERGPAETLRFGDSEVPYGIADLAIDDGFPLPFPTKRRTRNHLRWWQILLYGFVLAVGTVLLVAAGFNLLASIQTLLEAKPPT